MPDTLRPKWHAFLNAFLSCGISQRASLKLRGKAIHLQTLVFERLNFVYDVGSHPFSATIHEGLLHPERLAAQ